MEKFSLIDIGNVSAPMAEVVNNFVNKIAGALNYMMPSKSLGAAIGAANRSIIEEIASRQDINPIERAVIVSNYKKIMKQYKNQEDVVRSAVKHLKPNAVFMDVSDDWITFFFDKVKDVTDEYMKEIWGSILAGEFNAPNTYTKQFLHSMSIIDSNIAKMFLKIRSSCFYAKPYLYSMIYRVGGNDINNIKKYQEIDLFIKDFRELDNFGLIQYKFSAFHTWTIKNKVFCYGDKQIKFDTDQNSIALGNVALTDVGKQLCRVVPMKYDDRVLEICIDSWEKLGYKPRVIEGENTFEV